MEASLYIWFCHMIENLLQVFLEIKGVHLPDPFPRLTYTEAMSRYGSDRPDIRFDLELKDVIVLALINFEIVKCFMAFLV